MIRATVDKVVACKMIIDYLTGAILDNNEQMEIASSDRDFKVMEKLESEKVLICKSLGNTKNTLELILSTRG